MRNGRLPVRVAVVAAAIAALVAVGGFRVLANDDFTDVPPGPDFFHDDVSWLKDNAITGGCTPTTYCPTDPVTRGQMAAFMHRLSRVQVIAGAHTVRNGGATTVDRWFNNVTGAAPGLTTAGSLQFDFGFSMSGRFVLCSIDTNSVDTRDSVCTVSTPGGNIVRVRVWDPSAAAFTTDAEVWVLVYGLMI